MTYIYLPKNMFLLTREGYCYLGDNKPDSIVDELNQSEDIYHLKSAKQTKLIKINTNIGDELCLYPQNKILVFDSETQTVIDKKVSKLKKGDSLLRYKQLKDKRNSYDDTFAHLCAIFFRNYRPFVKQLYVFNNNEIGFVKKYFGLGKYTKSSERVGDKFLISHPDIPVEKYLNKLTPEYIIGYYLKRSYKERSCFVNHLLTQYTFYNDMYYAFKMSNYETILKLQMIFTSIGYRTLLRNKGDSWEIRVYSEKLISNTDSKKHIMNTLKCDKRLVKSLIDGLSYELNDTVTRKLLTYSMNKGHISEEKLYQYNQEYNLPYEWMYELLNKHYVRIKSISEVVADTYLFKTKKVIANNYKISL